MSIRKDLQRFTRFDMSCSLTCSKVFEKSSWLSQPPFLKQSMGRIKMVATWTAVRRSFPFLVAKTLFLAILAWILEACSSLFSLVSLKSDVWLKFTPRKVGLGDLFKRYSQPFLFLSDLGIQKATHEGCHLIGVVGGAHSEELNNGKWWEVWPQLERKMRRRLVLDAKMKVSRCRIVQWINKACALRIFRTFSLRPKY